MDEACKQDKDLHIRGVYGVGFGGIGLSDFVWGLEDILSALPFRNNTVPDSTIALQASKKILLGVCFVVDVPQGVS